MPAANGTVPVDAASFRMLPLAQLRTSTTEAQTQRRKYFDKVKLGELAESIAARGVVQPIVVRFVSPLDAGAPAYYEIVAGERRVRASELAKRTEIPAVVMELDDEEVIEVQLIENLQREDVHPMQEAEGYHQLVTVHGHSVDELPDKIGKSRSYVYARIKLLDLCEAARAAFYKGDIDQSRALLIARIPGEEMQQRALKQLTELSWDGEGFRMSYREAQRYVHDTFMLKLSTAPFARDDATLVPSAGACGPCPMRTGNATDLFEDVKGADVCTNPSCFKAKTAAHAKRELEKASADGAEVIRGAKAKRILPDSRYTVYGGPTAKQLRNGYARPRDKCLDDPKKRTYAELAGKDAPTVLLQHPDTGKVEKVIRLADVADKLKDKGIKPEAAPADTAAARARDNERREEERARANAARSAILVAIKAAAPKRLGRDELVAVVTFMFEQIDMGYGFSNELIGALGWDAQAKLPAAIEKMSEAELSQAALALTVADEFDDFGDDKKLNALAKRLGVDVKKIRADLAKPKEPEKETTKPAAKKKAKR
jgi:ParB/RepB/Spo0J family partition protein